jgi:hypothetical protein
MRSLSNNSDSLLNAMRVFGRDSFVPWFIAIALIAQAMIPLQSHTRLAVDERGMVIEVCTLEGIVEKTVSAADGTPELTEHDTDFDSGADTTPAMLFSQLMAEALLALDAVQPAWLALQVSEQPPAVIGTVTGHPLRRASIRAPPSLV